MWMVPEWKGLTMDNEVRNALTRVAVAAQFLANDIDPDRLEWAGTADDFGEFLEWHRGRNLSMFDARHLITELFRVFPHRVVGATPEILAMLLQHMTWPPAVADALAEVIRAIWSIGLQHEVHTTTIDKEQAARLRSAGEKLQEVAAFEKSELQREILKALDATVLNADELQKTLDRGRNPIYGRKDPKGGKIKRGGLNELMAYGLVKNDRKIGGYFRPDAPPG